MSTIRRMSRHRREAVGDPIIEAWRTGRPPPPEAYEPANREQVGDVIFFGWAEHGPVWNGPHHPYAAAWHDALVAA